MALRWFGGVLLTTWIGVACASPGDPAPTTGAVICELPAATGPYRAIDNGIVLELPDSGGVLANGAALSLPELETRLRGVFALQPVERRAVFVRTSGSTRCADVRRVAQLVREAGGHAFDADRSGWPRPMADALP